MTFSGDENADVCAEHPYWFARIIGAFHANLFILVPPRPQLVLKRWISYLLASSRSPYTSPSKL
ncbi:hypothetical protein BT96DRAFT_114153 [Gymnopus androsaceus JB14]|uniref:Uncharacterized protein n=1 Tax=Gymnopus androsaceus JB14 TaxID=1447944 RepID=A0A6A4GCG3_9AGAR|nr:hypothetical protein BT96DRAFT_114153 [Gymnopus androsaceus JB14]